MLKPVLPRQRIKAGSPQRQPKPKVPIASFEIEREFSHLEFIAGVDEVGRGCLAGPVGIAGVIFDRSFRDLEKIPSLCEINDSKQIDHEKREELAEWIETHALAYDYQAISETEIDEINILQATFRGAFKVVQNLEKKLGRALDMVLMDGPYPIPKVQCRQRPVIDGDQKSKSIAAASILAKVNRDRRMTEFAKEYPGYFFETNKGYGTSAHGDALRKLGPCAIHRKSFLRKYETLIFGGYAERKATEFLISRDFKILERNWRTKEVEIDIIAEQNGELHFFEVRARSKKVELALSFPVRKRAQFQKAVEVFLRTDERSKNKTPRAHLVQFYQEQITPHWDVFQW